MRVTSSELRDSGSKNWAVVHHQGRESDRLTEASDSACEESELATHDSQLDDHSSPRSRSRVLFVDQTAQLGGAELCLKDIVCNRSGNGSDCVILFQAGPLEDSLMTSGIDVMVCPLGSRAANTRKGSGFTKKFSALLDTIRLSRRVAAVARQFDVIYANTPKALVVSAIAGRLARRPVIYHLHDILSPEHFSKSNVRLLVHLANRFCQAVIANSHATADAFAEAGGNRSKVSVIYNGFELSKFEMGARKEDLNAMSWPKSAKLVAVFGRLAPGRGSTSPSRQSRIYTMFICCSSEMRSLGKTPMSNRFTSWRTPQRHTDGSTSLDFAAT